MAKQQPAKPANNKPNTASPVASQETKPKSELMVPDAAPDHIGGGTEGFENVRGDRKSVV